MKEAPAVIGLFLWLGTALSAQQTSEVHQHTTEPPNARFEVVQSEIAAKFMFRLDRYIGQVSQLVKTKDDDEAWEDMEVIAHPQPLPPGHPHWQLFMSGIAGTFYLLIDTDTGNSWMLTKAKRKASDGSEYDDDVWEPFAK